MHFWRNKKIIIAFVQKKYCYIFVNAMKNKLDIDKFNNRNYASSATQSVVGVSQESV